MLIEIDLNRQSEQFLETLGNGLGGNRSKDLICRDLCVCNECVRKVGNSTHSEQQGHRGNGRTFLETRQQNWTCLDLCVFSVCSGTTEYNIFRTFPRSSVKYRIPKSMRSSVQFRKWNDNDMKRNYNETRIKTE